MYKYFEISEDNLKFINEFKAEQGIKSDKEAFNKIIELYRDCLLYTSICSMVNSKSFPFLGNTFERTLSCKSSKIRIA